ncbi:UDP-glucose--hexose-1-phosphate uridylyltransferase [Paenibacillus senegalensis]|uniref:UDP-glucose--hexose-1-phosphate uridylyltransferase n=1 Tax=Paenibacillus senegalensis TaxID=1465766 RepID=UPI000289237F|nr:UDP-glucose--hexose-1-phosphate uridylyltransferase [Paenibacillus senegalensis]
MGERDSITDKSSHIAEESGVLAHSAEKLDSSGHGHIRQLLARLVAYGFVKGMLKQADVIPVMNSLCELLMVEEPCFPDAEDWDLFSKEFAALDNPGPILQPILDYAAERGLMPDDTVTYRDLLDAKIMGLLMPRASEVERTFRELEEDRGPEAAVEWFFQLSQSSNYIRMDRIRQNDYWLVATEFGDLEITVNLSKPEKDPKDIERERNLPAAHYPKCLLCVENVGYPGRLNHPARQNHRVIPLTLAGSQWHLQYSPYVYYREHCIILNDQHVPMKITDDTFERLMDFVERFPFYFIGSNAALPIVGGSILSHDHYQGGRHRFAMEKAAREEQYAHSDYPSVQIYTLRWPMPVIRLIGGDRKAVSALGKNLFALWSSYSDPDCDIEAFTSDGQGSQIPHNSVTPVVRKNREGLWELDLVLRNNRTTEEHPTGLFHPHRQHHHIKKENIGLIEVMGLAVLPGRLKQEMELMCEWLTNSAVRKNGSLDERLQPHKAWMDELLLRYGAEMSREEAVDCLKKEIGFKYLAVLGNAAVYKRDESGRRGLLRFMAKAGFQLSAK